MMHDITDDITNATLSSFADDTRLWKKIQNRQDFDILQEDLHKLYKWADHNNMEFNADKFEGVRYGNKEKQYYLAPDDTPIKQPGNGERSRDYLGT